MGGWDPPESTCLEKTQTHSMGLPDTEFKRSGGTGRRKHTKQRLLRANRARREGARSPEGEGGEVTHDFHKHGRRVYYQWGGGWLSAPNPQFIFSQKSSSRNSPLSPRGKDTVGQSHHTRIPTFPSSVEGEGNS